MKQNQTIVTVTVMTELTHGASSRVIGWWSEFESAIQGLANFGTESFYSYAVIEEFARGMHPPTLHVLWMKYNDDENEWQSLSTDEECDLTRCINHAIG